MIKKQNKFKNLVKRQNNKKERKEEKVNVRGLQISNSYEIVISDNSPNKQLKFVFLLYTKKKERNENMKEWSLTKQTT